MSDKKQNIKPDADKPKPDSEPLIKGDVPDFEYTPPPPDPSESDDSE